MILKAEDTIDTFPILSGDIFLGCDYLTLTSKTPDLRKYFFSVLKKIRSSKKILNLKKKKLNLGGPCYKGLSIKFTGENQIFLGSRLNRKLKIVEHILTIPGRIANIFIEEFWGRDELLKNNWKVTRLDLQCTMKKKDSKKAFVDLYHSQKELENSKPKNRRKKVRFYEKGNFCIVNLGSNKLGKNSLKIYKKKNGYTRIELSLRNTPTLEKLKGKKFGDLCKDVLRENINSLAATPLLEKHRWFCSKAPSKAPEKLQEEKETSNKKSKFKEQLIFVSEAHRFLCEKVLEIYQKKSHSHKKMRYLNEQFPTKKWRIAWNKNKHWCIVPTKLNNLYEALFEKLPRKTEDYVTAVNARKKALMALGEKLIIVGKNCASLPSRKVNYVVEPRRNEFIRELLLVSKKNEVFRDTIRLPRARECYSLEFKEKPSYVQEIIIERAKEKRAKESHPVK